MVNARVKLYPTMCREREVVTGRDRDTCKFRVEVMHAATRKLSVFTGENI